MQFKEILLKTLYGFPNNSMVIRMTLLLWNWNVLAFIHILLSLICDLVRGICSAIGNEFRISVTDEMLKQDSYCFPRNCFIL